MTREFNCRLCKEYKLFLNPDYSLYSEYIRVNNYLLFFKDKKVRLEKDYEIISKFDLEEFNPEFVKKWFNKLKTYTVFQ